MTPRLTSITVEDFRSIRGPVNVSLDAQVVLIHGPNGTGKTSLLSAIELGLTGAVGSIARMDTDYLKFLPHKSSVEGLGKVRITAQGIPQAPFAELVADGSSILGGALLSGDMSRFFTERCYLAQSTLGRLLEIYERQDTRRSDSALTKFVKELLGLEALDALIDGLHDAGDVRRLREPAPLFWAARTDIQSLTDKRSASEDQLSSLRTAIAETEASLRALLTHLLTPDQAIEAEVLSAQIDQALTQQEQRLGALARQRRDLQAAASQVNDATSTTGSDELAAAERESATAQETLKAWLAGSGAALETSIVAIQERFKDIPPMRTDPLRAHQQATAIVTSERARVQRLLEVDRADGIALVAAEESVRQGEGRISTIDAELSEGAGASNELAQALAGIASHIEGDDCPVCGRDFSEVSDTPLAAHVSEEIGRLVAAVGRMQALIGDRTATVGAVAVARRTVADISARRLTKARADALRGDLATFTEWSNSLAELASAAETGAQLLSASVSTAQRLATLTSQQSAVMGLRGQLATYAAQLGLPAAAPEQGLRGSVSALIGEIARQDAAASAALETFRGAADALEELGRLRVERDEAITEFNDAEALEKDLSARRAEADRRIGIARDLAARAQALRTEKVRQVFNDELNSVWRDLFIRLAPDEAFVPAFALPEGATGIVEALLETHYRSGGKGGNPRAMLSAGNLNTAALTLFLALHLSVKPALPWLIIDDPVQCMDDVHIAQFAALLRTLKGQGRQVILAVHDRQLFDYLALELSPAFNGDRLITVELGRNSAGQTTAPWVPTVYEPDKAIAA